METLVKTFRKILIIDDNPVDNLICKHFMQDVQLAKEYVLIDSSMDAYDYIYEELNSETNFPEIILLDLNMPMYNGFELLEKIETLVNMNHLDSRVYILSSSNNPADIKRATAFKTVAGYLVKPFNEEMVKQII